MFQSIYRGSAAALLALTLTVGPALPSADEHNHDHDHAPAPAPTPAPTPGHDHDHTPSPAPAAADPHAGHDHGEHGGHADVVHLTPAQVKTADLTVAAVGPAAIARSLEAPGEIAFNADRLAHLAPRTGGIVTEVLKTSGDAVTAGEALAVIQSAELGNAKIEYFGSRVNLELAQKDFARQTALRDNTDKLLTLLRTGKPSAEVETTLDGLPIGEGKSNLLTAYAAHRLAQSAAARAEKLNSDKLISEANYDLALREAESARARYVGAYEEARFQRQIGLQEAERALRLAELAHQNAERRLHMFGYSDEQLPELDKEKDTEVARFVLRAPFAGTLLERHLAVGEQVGPESDVFVLADLSQVWCLIQIHSQWLGGIRTGDNVTVRLTDTGRTHSAKLGAILPSLNEQSRTAVARVVLDNPDRSLRPGQFVAVSIESEKTSAPIAAPVAALQTHENHPVVFVVSADGHEFEARPVELGRRDAQHVEILGGLKLGEKIVVKNSFILKAELGKAGAVHEH